MVSYNIDSPTYSTKAIAWEKYYDWPEEKDIPSLSIVSSRQDNRIYAIIVNRNIEQDINVKIVVNGIGVVENVKLSILTGNSLDSTQVEMIERSQTIESNSLDLVLKRHSVVAIEFSPALP
jgi:alpha-L-arabinofuranosidase